MAKDPSLANLIDYLASGDQRQPPLSWPTTSLEVDLGGLSGEMLASARLALDAWTAATGVSFAETSRGADITFGDDDRGAYASYRYGAGGELLDAHVNVEAGWMDGFPADERWGVGDYGLQTFVHEIGHALGLNHPGDYNGSARYEADAIFAKDTNQFSVMSYFDQSEYGDATSLFVSGPMIADIAAIERLYGPLSANPGDSVYGRSGLFDFGRHRDTTFTISDSGGEDLIDLAGAVGRARLDMAAGAFSSINGHVDNLSIALGAVIENAIGSDAADRIAGNGVGNDLRGGGGDDDLDGHGGRDALIGGAGADALSGGAGADRFVFRTASEAAGDLVLDFGRGADRLSFAAIDADVATAGRQDFDFVGTDRFGETAGEVRYGSKGGETFLAADRDGDGRADLRLRLDGEIDLTAADFIL